MNIRNLKARLAARYPRETISEVLRGEPDQVSPEELIAKLATWQTIIDSGKK